MANDNHFNHPFEHPYQVQLDLMQEIYDTLKNDYKIGIFESPTGTGKTLSLICSTMTWLREYKKKLNDGIITEKLGELEHENEEDNDDEPEWVRQSFRDKILSEYLGEARKYEQHLQDVKLQGFALNVDSDDVKNGKVKYFKKRKQKLDDSNSAKDEENIDDLAPDDYDIGEEDISKNGLSKDVEQLLNKVESSKTYFQDSLQPTLINESKVKIFFVSRTHSQLSQFSSQLKLPTFPSSIDELKSERIKYLPMGSRKQLCINESVQRLNDIQAINKACQNLQQSTKDSEKCEFMPKPFDDDDNLRKKHLNDLVMSDIYDIEDIHLMGKKMNICPYYSTRSDIPVAEIISMPYQLLLHKDTRQILGLNLQNSVVIIDEAHNLLDTISRIYSSSISFKDLKLVRRSLKLYTKKFIFKMSAGNRINIAKLNRLLTVLYKFMSASIEANKVVSGSTLERHEIFGDDVTDLLNIYELESYLVKSKLAFKLESYMEKTFTKENSASGEYYKSSGQPLLFGIKSFLYSLSNPLKSGKFFWDKTADGNVTLKYLLLDPSEDFKDVVDESKCVLLAGGTMEPISEFTDFLVPYLENAKIKHFSCDHVIPDKNLLVLPVTNYKGLDFEFSFRKRNDTQMINNLGISFCELSKDIPDGVVAFFPSYNYLAQVIDVWKESGLWGKISNIKTLFLEEKERSVDETLMEYKKCIQLKPDTSKNGALLLSVVGGKMSEGINFSDELARAVFMVGLPYPNAFSSELIAKKEYIERKYMAFNNSEAYAKSKSQEYYENLCMKAVNQSVGRAIRNINDYAIIYLFDNRYRNSKIQNKLSGWVKKRILAVDTPVQATRDFFHAHSV